MLDYGFTKDSANSAWFWLSFFARRPFVAWYFHEFYKGSMHACEYRAFATLCELDVMNVSAAVRQLRGGVLAEARIETCLNIVSGEFGVPEFWSSLASYSLAPIRRLTVVLLLNRGERKTEIARTTGMSLRQIKNVSKLLEKLKGNITIFDDYDTEPNIDFMR